MAARNICFEYFWNPEISPLDYQNIQRMNGITFGIIRKDNSLKNGFAILSGYLEFDSPKRIEKLQKFNPRIEWSRRTEGQKITLLKYRSGNYEEWGKPKEQGNKKLPIYPVKETKTVKSKKIKILNRTQPMHIYDFHIERRAVKLHILKDLLQEISKRWIFHIILKENHVKYYGVMSLKKRQRLETVTRVITDKIKSADFELIQSNRQSNYEWEQAIQIEQDFIRIKGPWNSEQYKIENAGLILNPEMAVNLRPWQKHIAKDFKHRNAEYMKTEKWSYNDRTINMIITDRVDIGKSVFRKYCDRSNLAVEIFVLFDHKDIMENAFLQEKLGCYLIRIKCCPEETDLFRILATIEHLKSGVVFAPRYGRIRIDAPNIWVFYDKIPSAKLVKSNIWKLWTINENYELIELPKPTE